MVCINQFGEKVRNVSLGSRLCLSTIHESLNAIVQVVGWCHADDADKEVVYERIETDQ